MAILAVLLKCDCFCLRADFEEMISSSLQRLETTLKSLLEKSGLYAIVLFVSQKWLLLLGLTEHNYFYNI